MFTFFSIIDLTTKKTSFSFSFNSHFAIYSKKLMAHSGIIKDREKILDVICRSKVVSKTPLTLQLALLKMTHSKEHRVGLLTSSIISTTAAYDTGSSIYFSNQSTDKKKFRSRKKSNYKHVPHYLKPAHLVAKRNARERLRVQAVKSAFVKLSKHVPTDTRHKKLSKLKTLKLAISYIQNLRDLITQHDQFLNGNNYSPGIIQMINQQNDVVLVDTGKACENVGLHHQDDFISGTNAHSRPMHESCRKSSHYDSDVFNLTKVSYENLECIFIKEVSLDVPRSLSLDRSATHNHYNGYMSSEQICSNVRSAAPKFEDGSEVISPMFGSYVGDIHFKVDKTITTKCYLNEHSQHALNRCVLSSCAPCRNMVDQNHQLNK